MKFQDLIGQRFNKLVVIGYVGKGNFGQSRWLCQCDCGKTKEIFSHHLKSHNVKSCGCLAIGEPRRLASTTHGMIQNPEYVSYHAAKKRCLNKNSSLYPDYGGRGIEFRFQNFEEFFAEVGPRPEPKFEYSLDRIDNDGHYERGNVRWATKKQQARNRRCDKCGIHLARIRDLERQLALCARPKCDT